MVALAKNERSAVEGLEKELGQVFSQMGLATELADAGGRSHKGVRATVDDAGIVDAAERASGRWQRAVAAATSAGAAADAPPPSRRPSNTSKLRESYELQGQVRQPPPLPAALMSGRGSHGETAAHQATAVHSTDGTLARCSGGAGGPVVVGSVVGASAAAAPAPATATNGLSVLTEPSSGWGWPEPPSGWTPRSGPDGAQAWSPEDVLRRPGNGSSGSAGAHRSSAASSQRNTSICGGGGGSKAHKLLGIPGDAPLPRMDPAERAAAAAAAAAPAETPWFMRAEPLPDDLVLDDQARVRLATPPRLVERLVHPTRFDDRGKFDHRFCAALLLTYRSFYTPQQLLAALLEAYQMAPPQQLHEEEESRLKLWEVQRLLPVQLMVCNVLQKWITHYLYDGDLDGALLAGFREFVAGPLSCTPRLAKFGTKLTSALEKKSTRARQSSRAAQLGSRPGSRSVAGKRSIERTFDEPPPPILFSDETFTQFDRPAGVAALEWARQLTTLEFALFEQLQPKELLGLAWGKKDKEMRAPNVLALIHHFNAVSNWAATNVLNESELEKRVEAFTHTIEVAAACLELGNFNAMQEMMAGLDLSACYRLKRTKEALPPKVAAKYEDMRALCAPDQNRKAYRQALAAATPPCIPYLGVYLTDLTFLEEGNPNTVTIKVGEGTDAERDLELIQWSKHQQYAAIIEDIRFYQQTHYNLARCEPLQRFLTDDMEQVILSADEQYARSLEVEPRGQPGGGSAPPVDRQKSQGRSSLVSASAELSTKNLWSKASEGAKRGQMLLGAALNNNL